jgi:hypothetical protein
MRDGGIIMKYCSSILFFLLCGTVAFAQDRGIIECGGRISISAWEKPGSLFVARQLSCGQTVTVIGMERGYIKILINQSIVGYVDAQYIQPLQSKEQPKEQQEDREKQLQPPTPVVPADSESRRKIADPLPSHIKSAREGIRIHRSEFGVEISHIKYAESSVTMQEQGIMGGASGSYAFRPKQCMFRLEGRFSLGAVDYSSPSGEFNNISNYTFETRVLLGREFKSEKTLFTPFVGIGYRFLYDDLGYVSGGYDRRANYLYSPIGMESTWNLGNGWAFGIAGEYDLFWRGWQYSRLSDYISGIDTLINRQTKGWGARGSVRIIKKIGAIDFAFEPFLRHWDINRSDVMGITYNGNFTGDIGWEPPNTSTEWGAKVGVRF